MSALPRLQLEPVQRLATSGARAVEPFTHDGRLHLVVPQLAADIAGQPRSMTGGNSDLPTLVYRWQDGAFVEQQRLDSPGGEDAECFVIGERRFLAVASLRSGSGPYVMDVDSIVYEWNGERFEPFQRIAGHAAKQWHHFAIDGRHFLALAQGAAHDESSARPAEQSCIFEWTGSRFEPFQAVPSAWGYNWLGFKAGGQHWLAYADHVAASGLLRWNGRAFEPHQAFADSGGRAFAHFTSGGEDWLAFARLTGDSMLYRFDAGRFVEHRVLEGTGGREFAWLPHASGGHLVRVNFIRGSREAPQSRLRSQIYALDGSALLVESEFDTSGASDAAFFEADGATFLAVSQALAEPIGFRVDSRIYRVLGA